MRGKHIKVASIKAAAMRHRALCILMAIALLGIMIPNGLRAHAEEEATQVQTEEQAAQDQTAEDQDAVDELTAAENSEVAEEAEPNADVTLNLTTLPNAGDGYWHVDGVEKTSITDLPDTAVVFYDSTTPSGKLEIYESFMSLISGDSAIHTLKWYNNHGAPTFKYWLFDNIPQTQYGSTSDIYDGSVLAAALEGYEPPTYDVSLSSEPSNSVVFYDEDGNSISVVEDVTPGFVVLPSNNNVVIYDTKISPWIPWKTLTFDVNEGYTFREWSTSALEVLGDCTLTAYCDEDIGYIDIFGKVTDTHLNPIIGADVTFVPDSETINADEYNTSTNEDGDFNLRVPEKTGGTLTISFDEEVIYQDQFTKEDMEFNINVNPVIGESYMLTIQPLGNEANVSIEMSTGQLISDNQLEVPTDAYFYVTNGSTEDSAELNIYYDDEDGTPVLFATVYVWTLVENQLIEWTYAPEERVDVESDMTVNAIVMPDVDAVALTIEPSDEAMHQYFDSTWMINGEIVENWQSPVFDDFIYIDSEYSFDENGVITVTYVDPSTGEATEDVIIEAVPAEGYVFDSYVDANTGEALTVNTTYVVGEDVNLAVNYKIVGEDPQQEEITAQAQTGDSVNLAFAGFAILALISGAYIAYRRVRINK